MQINRVGTKIVIVLLVLQSIACHYARAHTENTLYHVMKQASKDAIEEKEEEKAWKARAAETIEAYRKAGMDVYVARNGKVYSKSGLSVSQREEASSLRASKIFAANKIDEGQKIEKMTDEEILYEYGTSS